jgi:parvulin-like peptidyl-prolyl isomerase
MARRIPLPRLTRRQRRARWQRERRQQAVIVVVFSAVLFFVIGLVAYGASERYYEENLKPAMRFDGIATPTRDWKNEVKYQQVNFFVQYGVPTEYENDPSITEQKAGYERSALDSLVERAILKSAVRDEGVVIADDAVDARFLEDFSQYRSRHILILINKEAADQAIEAANALAKATAVRDQLRQDPSNQTLWNQLAADVSEDTGTKESGGELGWVGKGQFVKPYEDAARTLAIGEISEPIKSDYGYHVIQVEERRGPEESEIVKRWFANGFSVADIKAHARQDLLREEFTKRRQEQTVVSPTAQIHVAIIQVAPPRYTGDIQAFQDQLKRVGDVNDAISKGTDFGEIAKQYSEDSTTAEQGGDIGWVARGMLTDLRAEDDLFALEAGKVTPEHNTLTATTWYKVLEKNDARALDEDQTKKIKDSAYQYWLNRQKKAHDVLRLIPGLEFD